MKKTYNLQANEILFKVSDIYNHEQIYLDNCLGENLFGKLVLHRVENIVYTKLKKNGLKMGAFTNSLAMLYDQGIKNNFDYEKNLLYICKIFAEANFKYALLKGAFLITTVYEKGMRYSNDIDILIEEKDIDACQKLLFKNGFIQGELVNGKLQAATRREIVLSRMNYGETIPFCKLCGDRPVYVDLNFSLDYKPTVENKIIQSMLENAVSVKWNNCIIRTLDICNFIIHLCMHLYKEATTYEWVKRRRDLNLYKFNDLNMMFHECVNKDDYEKLVRRIVDYEAQKECYYALFYASKIYKCLEEIDEYNTLVKLIKPDDSDYLHMIIDPENKKIYKYNMSFEEWFACEDRVKQLVIVNK